MLNQNIFKQHLPPQSHTVGMQPLATQHRVNCKTIKHNNMTYRNSCLAVLVGDVGKSSSLQMKIEEKARKTKTKQIKNKQSCKISQLITCNPQYDIYFQNYQVEGFEFAYVCCLHLFLRFIIIFPLSFCTLSVCKTDMKCFSHLHKPFMTVRLELLFSPLKQTCWKQFN